jgi:uracil-DNA glycosylase
MVMKEPVIEFYEKVVSCPNTPKECPNVINSIEKDYPPRGFMSGGTPGDIDIMIVGKNPGHIAENEKGAYSGKSSREIAEGMFRNPTWTIPAKGGIDTKSYTFHRNLIRYICYFLDINNDEVFKRCVYTNLVKCSTINEREKLKAKTITECFGNHLKYEIILWKPKVLLALGREAYNFLNDKQIKEEHDKPVIYIKHPSYYYRKEKEREILDKIKTEIQKYLL